jgi:hypothetical protein
MSKIPFGSLLTSRSKTDHAKQLKDLFIVIENEQDKEKKHYEEVSNHFNESRTISTSCHILGNQEYSQDPIGIERWLVRATRRQQ